MTWVDNFQAQTARYRYIKLVNRNQPGKQPQPSPALTKAGDQSSFVSQSHSQYVTGGCKHFLLRTIIQPEHQFKN